METTQSKVNPSNQNAVSSSSGQTAELTKPTRLSYLSFLKFAAMIAIILWHVVTWSSKPFDVGARMCEFLIIASGFLVGYNHFKKPIGSKISDVFKYIHSKLRVFLPLHLICLFLFFFFRFSVSISGFNLNSAQSLLAKIFLVQAWSPVESVVTAWNGISWFLSALLFCYALAPFMLKAIKNKKLSIIFFVVVLTIRVGIELFIKMGGDNIFNIWLHANPAIKALEFFLGMLIVPVFYWIKERLDKYSDKVWLKLIWTFVEIVVPAITIFLMFKLSDNVIRAVYVAIFCVVVFITSFNYGYLSKFFSLKIPKMILSYQFGMFMFQLVVDEAIKKPFNWLHIDFPQNIVLQIIIKVSAILTVAIIYHEFVAKWLAIGYDKIVFFFKRIFVGKSDESEQAVQSSNEIKTESVAEIKESKSTKEKKEEPKEPQRTRKSVANVFTGFLSQGFILVLNFAVRFIFIRYLGYEYLGINSLFTSILTILSVADLGFGSALGIVLYGALSRKNEDVIAGLMRFFRRVYLIIGLSITVVGLGITPFVKYLVNTDQEIPHLSLYFLFFLANTVSSYFVNYRTILIRADQKNYVVNNTTTIIKIAKAILECAVLLLVPRFFGLTVTYVAYLFVMVLATYAIGTITAVYAKKKYPYAFRKVKVKKEDKKEIVSTTKDLLIYRLCAAFSSPIDSILISLFVGTALLGVYSNYLLIFTTVMEFVCLVSRNVISSVGNFVVEKPLEQQKKLYFEMQAIYFAIIVFVVINYVGLITPFIQLVFKSENTLSMWVAFLFGFTLICRCTNELMIIFRETTKIYKKTRYISLVNTVLHIGLSALLGHFFGIEGIMLGSIIAYFSTNFWFELFALFKWHFKERSISSFLYFFYVIFIAAAISVGVFFLNRYLISLGNMYIIANGIVSFAASFIAIGLLFFIRGFKDAFIRIKGIAMKFFEKYKEFINNKKWQTIILISYAVLLFSLLVVRDIPGLPIHKFVFLGLMIATVLLLKPTNAYLVILFTLPISPSTAELYVLLFALAYFFITTVRNHRWRQTLIIFSFPVLLFILEIVLSYFYGGISITNALRIFSLLCMLSIFYYDRKAFTKKHIYAILLGFILLLSVIAINWIIPAVYGVTHKNPQRTWLSMTVLLREVRLGMSTASWITTYAAVDYPMKIVGTLGENQNNIGLISIVSLATLLSLYGSTRRKEKVLTIILIGLFLIFGAWSLSRTFILVVALLFVGFIVLGFLSKQIKFLDALIVFFVGTGGAALILICVPTLFTALLKRFTEASTASGGNRIPLIGYYLKAIFSDWKYALFGVGVSNMVDVYAVGEQTHTNFVQFIGSYGLLTFVGFIGFFVASIINTKRLEKFRSQKLQLILPVTFATIFTLTIQLFYPSIILITFIPAILALSFLNKECSKEKEIHYYSVYPRTLKEGEKPIIAMCSTSFGGGISSYVRNISEYLTTNKLCDMSFVFNPDTTIKEVDSFGLVTKENYTYSKKSKFKIVHLIRKYLYYSETFDKINPDIIYVNTSSYTRSLILLLAARFHKSARIIIHSHNAVNGDSKLPFIEKVIRFTLLNETMFRFSCSKEAGLVYFGKSFTKRKTDCIAHNYIDVERFNYNSTSRDEIRKQYGIKKTDVLLGTVGRLATEKNQLFAVNLLQKLPIKYKLMIVGDGPEKVKIIESAKSLGVEERLILVPNTSDVERYYCAFDYFIFPSLIEGLPFVGVEAQCSGLSCIVSSNLPKSLSLTDLVTFEPLELDSWASCILNTKPTLLRDRTKYSSKVNDAGFSKQTAPALISQRITEITYEK